MSDQRSGKRRGPALLLAAALLLGVEPARTAPLGLLPPVVGAAELYDPDSRTGLALRGFDPVTYHLPGGPRGGRRDIETLWGGAAWRFESEANRQAFLGAPEAYAPRIGGRDPASAAAGIVAEAEPEIFSVVEGRLYLFRSEAARAAFAADPGLRRRAEEAWPALARTLVQP